MGDSDRAHPLGKNSDIGWWRNVLWIVVLAGAGWFLCSIKETLVVFGVAWLIAYLLNPVITTIEGRRLWFIKRCSRTLAIGIVYVVLVGLLVGIGAVLFPQVSNQVQKLMGLQDVLSNPQKLTVQIQDKVEFLLDKVPQAYRKEVQQRATGFLQNSASKIGTWVGEGVRYLAVFIGQIVSGLFLFLTGLVISVYVLQVWHGMGHGFVELLPRAYQEDVRSLAQQMHEIFGGYLKAVIITSVCCGVLNLIGLLVVDAIFGVSFPYIYIVALVAGLTYPIPVLGILASSILALVLGFLAHDNLIFSIAVGLTVFGMNVIIDRTIQPKVMSEAIGVSPLFVMFGAFAGGELLGLWGMLLGIPLSAMAKAVLTWFHGRFLAEPPAPSHSTPPGGSQEKG